MNKLFFILSLICLLIAATAKAEIILVEPKANSTIELITQTNKPTQIEITIKNTSMTPIQNIQFTAKDLNANFSQKGFGLDANKQKTITATITVAETTEGSISVNGQSFAVKIVVSEIPNQWQQMAQHLEKNQTLIFIGLFIIAFALIIFVMRKI